MLSKRLRKAHALRWVCWLHSSTSASHLQNILFEEPNTLKPVVLHQAGMQDILRKEYLVNMWEVSFSSKNNKTVSLSFPLLTYVSGLTSFFRAGGPGWKVRVKAGEHYKKFRNLQASKPLPTEERDVQPKNFHPYVCFFSIFPPKIYVTNNFRSLPLQNHYCYILNFSI